MANKPKLVTRAEGGKIVVEIEDPPRWIMEMTPQEALDFSSNLHFLAEAIIEENIKKSS